MSSPLTVLRFSCWHFSDAVREVSACATGIAPANQMPRTFASDEGYELANTLLHALLGLFGDLRVFGQSGLHDSRDWSKVVDVSIGIGTRFRAFGTVLWLL
jgi:hypothetical protein